MKLYLLSIDNVLPFIIPMLSGIVGYVVARKKNSAEVRKIDAETDLLELDGLKERLELYKDQIGELIKEVIKLRDEVAELKEENHQLNEKIAELLGKK